MVINCNNVISTFRKDRHGRETPGPKLGIWSVKGRQGKFSFDLKNVEGAVTAQCVQFTTLALAGAQFRSLRATHPISGPDSSRADPNTR